MRWILHVDMNSYFASVEQQSNPRLRGKPIGIGGKPGTRSIIAAASQEAKARGIKTAMSSWDAIRICPELTIVEPNYKKYQYYSEKMFGILESFSPKLEIFSIDEAFVDISSQVTGNSNQDETEYTAQQITAIVQRIKQRFNKSLGEMLTATVGVGHGKRLAKLAGEMQKPNGYVVLVGDNEAKLRDAFRQHNALAFTRSELYTITDIEELCGIGPQLGRRLRAAGIQTLADLAHRTIDELKIVVSPYHKELYLVGQGIDPSPTVSYRQAKAEQSIGHMYTLPHDLPVIDLPSTLAYIAEKVGRRMRRKAFVAHRIHLYLRFSKQTGGGWSSTWRTSQQLASDRDIYGTVWRLIDAALTDPGSDLTQYTLIRMPAITASDLQHTQQSPQSLIPEEQQAQSLVHALESIRDTYGDRAVTSGLSFGTKLHDIPDGRRKRFRPHEPFPEVIKMGK